MPVTIGRILLEIIVTKDFASQRHIDVAQRPRTYALKQRQIATDRGERLGLPKIRPNGASHRNAKAEAGAMRIVRAAVRSCCEVAFVMAALTLNTSARPDKFIIKYVNIRQLLDGNAPKEGSAGAPLVPVRSDFNTCFQSLLSNQPLTGHQKVVGTTGAGFGWCSPVYRSGGG